VLVRLLYVSRAINSVDQATMDAIMAKSRANNPPRGITGILCYSGEVFIQVIEGGRDDVNALYNIISRDPRHQDPVILHYEEIPERRFSGWTMGQANLDRVNPALLLKYSEKPMLNPYAVSGKVSMALLEELISTAAIVGRA
jgi:Sensors of blue-light using FAD